MYQQGFFFGVDFWFLRIMWYLVVLFFEVKIFRVFSKDILLRVSSL